MNDLKNNEKGFALFYVTVVVLAIIVAASSGVSFLTYNQQKIFKNVVDSSQAYYAAEAGVEDALLRLKEGMDCSSQYSFDVGTASVSNTIDDEPGETKIITGQGSKLGKARSVSVTYSLSSEEVSFYYGAQIGEGGAQMGNNSRIKGNVFSNASITPIGGGTGVIDDSVVVAGNGNEIQDLEIGGDAQSYTCRDCEIEGDLTYVSGGTLDNCDVDGSIIQQSEEIESQDMPITQEQINQWKQEAEAGGVIPDYTLGILRWESLGPKKVEGDMLIQNLSTLTLTGTVWVTGSVTLKNFSMIRLDEDYQSKSGLIIADGKVTVENGTWLMGSGAQGSYLMLLSTDDSQSPTSPAININNMSVGDGIFYAGNGLVRMNNGVYVKEVTAYKLRLDNNAEVDYESGLENAAFSSGPGASWQVTSWKETE